jgi:hypothetical protein
MQTAEFRITETDLSSRQAAAKLRAQIETRALAGGRSLLQIGAVLSMSESYADELIGVLAARYGLEWVFSHVAFEAASPGVARAIVAAIRQRLEAGSPDLDSALAAAKQVLAQRQARAA